MAVDAPMKNEFEELYSSLFKNAQIYKKVVWSLANKKVGMTRLELLAALAIPATGKLTEVLETLESSGFIRSTTLSSPIRTAWRGYAFERLCLQHLPQLCRALGIGAVHVEAYGWSFRGDDTYPDGVQIDLVLERADNIINVCEIKCSSNVFAIDKLYAANLDRKMATFAGVTRTRKALHLTLISLNGLLKNSHSSRIQSEVVLDDLFA